MSDVEAEEVAARRSLPSTKLDKLKGAKALVEKAIKEQKVFSVQGRYPVIRAGLRARGWVERYLPNASHGSSHRQSDKDNDEDDGSTGTDNCAEIKERGDNGKEDDLDNMYDFMSRLVRNERTCFYWSSRYDSIYCRSLRQDQVTNHYAKTGNFTTKVGLCVNLRNLRWYDTADPDTFFPRCYRLGAEDERHAFIEDFRRTACSSLLKHVVETNMMTKEPTKNEQGKAESFVALVSAGVINTALQKCQEYLSVLAHSDIDVTAKTLPFVEENQWNHFLQKYYSVVHKGASIRSSADFVGRCQAMLAQLKEVCPQMDIDGVNNIWIIKPGAMSRGRGIVCMNRLDQILALVDSDRNMAKDSKWVVQKYLEQPMLINGTKFDLRQWFLVTDWNPLTVWFYRECYLRFSTQPYSTKKLHSSVHLCNNAIQKHFQPSHERHPGVPRDNMWSSSDFKAFLQQQGREAQWETVVVPGMQQAVVHVLQTAQDNVEHRKATFELYGADFMLGNDLRPWLLEVNASPTMACTSVVTARLCPAVQLDTLRVVLDKRNNPYACTGGFRLIYKQPAVETPQFIGLNLIVEGNHIKKPKSTKRRKRVGSTKPHLTQSAQIHFSSEDSDVMSKHQAESCEKTQERRSSPEKRQKTPSPRRERQERAVVHDASLVSEQHVVEDHTRPRRRPQCSGGRRGGSGAPLPQRSISFSHTPKPHNASRVCKSTIKPSHGVYLWRSFLPRTFSEPCNRPSTRVTSFSQEQLPLLRLTSMQPGNRRPSTDTFQIESSYRFHKQRYMQTMSRYK
ncbi:tubulin monoglycylase TTLL3-like [Phycodurus eques]|uniref:tubulin monoglycylase TTLL3-like n=1 Tax=Phycodurus eques TaxID=693459 RepID=UPI002ACECE85|nr:tubulin monoglycylase TTLL3-like [Phycodurus eques]XP_061543878.1 tubulin monoglycylase TTLL3-like [Phycodurus eques]XP_061543879.1 tubulin monoglycylase TTLL3-like [Phycodurus eques]